MNILVISSIYPSESNPLSGIFVHSQVQELVKQGFQVKILAPVPLAPFPLPLFSKKWRRFHATPGFGLVNEIEVYYPRYLSLPRNWLFEKSGGWMYAGMRELVSEIAKEFPFDLIHAHVALPTGYAAMRVAAENQKPYIVTIHGADLQKTIHLNQKCKGAVAEVISHSSAVVLVSNKLRRIAEDQFGISNKFKVISNGIDPEYIHQVSYRNPAEIQEQKTILSVSNLFPTKGIDINLYALEKLAEKHPDTKYLVIGDGPERKKLVGLARELNLSNRVEFLGQLPHDQVMSHMAECDIFSLPSWQDGFGIVYLEAMAQGKPVIGCQGEGIEDFVVDSETGFLVKPKDSDDLARVLDNLLENPRLGIQVGARAQQTVQENYTWERNAREVIRIYEECIDV